VIWLSHFKYDPLKPLLNSENRAIEYFVRRLKGEKVGPISQIWDLPEVKKTLSRQKEDGSFKHYKKTDVYPNHHHNLVETWKRFRHLVNRYKLTRAHPKGKKAAEFIFSCQTKEGDIRGMIGNQYATYYTGAMMALLIKAGYERDPRIEKGFQWLLDMRHSDGGWTVPMQTHELSREESNRITSEYAEALEPKRDQPSSRLATDMVLRAFAADPLDRYPKVARRAGNLLKSWFFKSDNYSSYKDAGYWVRFAFWWPNLKTSLDSLSLLGFSRDDPDIKKALEWFVEHQQPNGLWKLSYRTQETSFKDTPRNKKRCWWLTLDICGIFKRFFSEK
jgi:hypothetical protein